MGRPAPRGLSGASAPRLVEAGRRLLIDVTPDFSEQCQELDRLDGVVLTHAHRDACGGIAALRGWWRERASTRLRIYASSETIRALRARFRRLDHCEFVPVREGQRRRLGPMSFTALTVPHAREPRYPTYAWRIGAGGRTVVYASDVARLTPRLRRFSSRANLLVIDGAMWRRRLFSHLTIDTALPELCRWPVDSLVLTQIGRSAPPHPQLEREVAKLCARAVPAYDGMEVRL